MIKVGESWLPMSWIGSVGFSVFEKCEPEFAVEIGVKLKFPQSGPMIKWHLDILCNILDVTRNST